MGISPQEQVRYMKLLLALLGVLMKEDLLDLKAGFMSTHHHNIGM
jgi:hypothetical protein